MRINKDNFIRELLNKNEKALEFVIDEYGSLINGIVDTIVIKHLGIYPLMLKILKLQI